MTFSDTRRQFGFLQILYIRAVVIVIENKCASAAAPTSGLHLPSASHGPRLVPTRVFFVPDNCLPRPSGLLGNFCWGKLWWWRTIRYGRKSNAFTFYWFLGSEFLLHSKGLAETSIQISQSCVASESWCYASFFVCSDGWLLESQGNSSATTVFFALISFASYPSHCTSLSAPFVWGQKKKTDDHQLWSCKYETRLNSKYFEPEQQKYVSFPSKAMRVKQWSTEKELCVDIFIWFTSLWSEVVGQKHNGAVDNAPCLCSAHSFSFASVTRPCPAFVRYRVQFTFRFILPWYCNSEERDRAFWCRNTTPGPWWCFLSRQIYYCFCSTIAKLFRQNQTVWKLEGHTGKLSYGFFSNISRGKMVFCESGSFSSRILLLCGT